MGGMPAVKAILDYQTIRIILFLFSLKQIRLIKRLNSTLGEIYFFN